MIRVKKKNGKYEKWSFKKIAAAVNKSAARVSVTLNKIDMKVLEEVIMGYVGEDKEFEISEIHSFVERALKLVQPVVAESYINYRIYRKDVVAAWDSIFQKAKDTLYLGDRENANFDSALISTKGSLIRGYLTKELYTNFHLNKKEAESILDGYVYIHDLRDLIFGGFNCCLFDIAAILKGGFEMSGVKYKEPKSVLSALQVIGDITLVATAQQFGGFTIAELDSILVPYVEKSLMYHKKEAKKYKIKDGAAYAVDKTLNEIMQGMQSLEMKLNTVPSSRGDTAFVTVSFGNCDGKVDKNIQRTVSRCILETRMKGQGNGSPVVFPKLVYLHSEKQHEDPKQEELFDFAIQCSSKAMYPDYLSLDNSEVGEIFARTGKVPSPMGCRAYLSDYKDANGESYFVGRANIGAVSLNLPMIWKKSNGETFWQDLDDNLQLIREFHLKRYEAVANNVCSTNPLAFTQGGIVGGNKKPTDKIGFDIVKSFTASFGITSLNELNMLSEGKPLHESDRRFVNLVVDHISEKVKEFKEADGYSYALYATPAESLAGTQLQQFRKMFGSIPGVSDREYFSNGFHCHVSADISPFEKQDMEHELFHKITGGHIQYVRLDNPRNLAAIKAVVKRGMKMGFYQGVNFDLVVCEDCGHRPLKYNPVCSKCGSTDITETSRVCGYLGQYHKNGGTRFNDSKIAEVKERVSM